jgi:hypothetical protein
MSVRIKLLTAAISATALLVSTALPTTAQSLSDIPYPSGQWVSVAGNQNDQTDVDVKTAQQQGNFVRFWQRQLSNGFDINQGKTTLLYTSVNCANHAYQFHRAVSFDSSGQFKGQVDTPSKWRNSIPGSIGEALVQFVCQ